jgi:hypothetical protein
MQKFQKTEQIIISEAMGANPYNFPCNSMRRGDDKEVSNHRSRGKYQVGSLLSELTPEEREELKDFNSERLSRTEKDSTWKEMEFIGREYGTKPKGKGRWGSRS